MKKFREDSPKYFRLVLYKYCSKKLKTIKSAGTKSQAKFSKMLRLIPDKFYALLKVTYKGGGWNDGFYSTKKDLLMAYKAFIEK